ncbi:MAG: hypothetical protein IPH50_00355 [Rhodanobacteraceae bacterium]|nr:hypothetical protein [Rhodanobacteraceae bacterium]
MNDQELNDLMRDYAAELAAYKRLPQSEPTALLDRAVLAKARAAIAHAPPARHRPPRWIAFAASFVGVAFAAGIGWRVYEARQMQESAAVAVPTPRKEVFEVDVQSSDRRNRDNGLDMAQLPSAPPAPIPPAMSEPRAFKDGLAKQEMSVTTAEAPVLAAPPPAPTKSSEPDRYQRADHGGATASPERRQNIAAPASATAATAAEVVGGLSADAESERTQGVVDQQAAGSDATAKRKADLLPPEPWLERIRQLVQDGRHTAARSELHRFHQAYPEIVIPADLRRYQP